MTVRVNGGFRRNVPGLAAVSRLFSRNGHHPPHKGLDPQAIRKHFLFPKVGRIVTNNAATTQVPVELLRMHAELARGYENVHRGQSQASRRITRLFEESYETVADFLHAPEGKRSIVLYRNTTEAINSLMYCLMSEFRDGDNVVTTMMEHNSNYVPWYAMCNEILPKFGRHVQCRIAGFSRETGQLDLNQLADLIDERTKVVSVTGASNFLGTRNPIQEIGELAHGNGYRQPNGVLGAYMIVDGAQLVPAAPIDVRVQNFDFLAFSMHKMLAPFGIGVLYARQPILSSLPPFLYGGDMIAEGQVFPEHVGYNELPWKFTAGTPNIMGTILSAQTLRLLLDLAADGATPALFGSARKIEPETVQVGMGRVKAHLSALTSRALERATHIPGITVYGPTTPSMRSSLLSFNVAGWSPMELAAQLDKMGVESRAGCHCATLAHHYLGLNPPASCRLSFYIYNTFDDVEAAFDALEYITSGRRVLPTPAPGPVRNGMRLGGS